MATPATTPAPPEALPGQTIPGDTGLQPVGSPSTLGLGDDAPPGGFVKLERLGDVPLGTSSNADPPSSSVPPEPESPPPPPPKVFIVGNKHRFGGKYVKKAMQAMLDAYDGKKAKGKTHSKLTPEDAEKLRAIMNSQDPAVQAMLNTKVPKHKSFMIDDTGKILATLDTKTQVMTEKTLGMEKHDMGWERTAGGKIGVGDKEYQVAGTELHSPIKIALDGVDAALNSTGGFAIDLDGFGQGRGAVQTSGGLNANEAWLVRDKDSDGITKQGVVDGRDVYGDHEGKFGNGYEELAKDYSSEVKTDPATGKHYLDLSDPNSRAAKELKLLDAKGNTVPAGQFLKRIDVDFKDVRESDATGQNQIRQRADVTYKDGHTAASADQWYGTK